MHFLQRFPGSTVVPKPPPELGGAPRMQEELGGTGRRDASAQSE